jgi:chemotaxis protein CheD
MWGTTKSKVARFNPAALPMEYMPKMVDVSDSKHAKHYLIPGKVFVSADAVAVSTIVGTGVSVCLWDTVRRIGGINHFLLPTNPEGYLENTKYADAANHTLLQSLIQLGADPRSMEASIFGGSQPAVTFSGSVDCLGDRNVQIALDFLGRRQIRLVQREVGGTHGRKLVFQTDDGRTWSQQL